jgi:hypothetical protein
MMPSIRHPSRVVAWSCMSPWIVAVAGVAAVTPTRVSVCVLVRSARHRVPHVNVRHIYIGDPVLRRQALEGRRRKKFCQRAGPGESSPCR